MAIDTGKLLAEFSETEHNTPAQRFVRHRKWMLLSAGALAAVHNGWFDVVGMGKSIWITGISATALHSVLTLAASVFFLQGLLLAIQAYSGYRRALTMRLWAGFDREIELVLHRNRSTLGEFGLAMEDAKKFGDVAEDVFSYLNGKETQLRHAMERLTSSLGKAGRQMSDDDLAPLPESLTRDVREALRLAQLTRGELLEGVGRLKGTIERERTLRRRVTHIGEETSKFLDGLDESRKRSAFFRMASEVLLDMLRYFPTIGFSGTTLFIALTTPIAVAPSTAFQTEYPAVSPALLLNERPHSL